MNDKKIKILVNENSGEMSFYRMEGGRWCLIDDSDDYLRPYTHENASSTIWDNAFFHALRQAVFAQDEEQLEIWFEGSADAYNDFHERLDDCKSVENVCIKRVKQKKVNATKASTESETSSPIKEKVLEEKEDESTGLLQIPDSDIWSWRINFSEKNAEEKEVIEISENQIVDKDIVLINKLIILRANISVCAKIECIHCSIFVDGEFPANAHIDIMKNACVWLKHCVLKNLSNKTWSSFQEDKVAFLRVYSDGGLHIYDSVFPEVSVDPKNWLVENNGICHIVDTDFRNCIGNFFLNRAEFCGSWICTTKFDGWFIKEERLTVTPKYRIPLLENCTFGSIGICRFLQFQGHIYRCRFAPIGSNIPPRSQIFIGGNEIQSNVEKCIFRGILSIQAEGKTTFNNCEFESCVTLDRSLLYIDHPQNLLFQHCKFERCICREIVSIEVTEAKKKIFSCALQDNIFKECISDKIIRIESKPNSVKIAVCDNQFLSCACSQYYGLAENKKNDYFKAENNQVSGELTQWVQEQKKNVMFIFTSPLTPPRIEPINDQVIDTVGNIAAMAASMFSNNPIGAGTAAAIIGGKSLIKHFRKKDTREIK